MKRVIAVVFSLLAVIFVLPLTATILLSFSNGFQGYIDLFFDCFVFYPMFWNSVIYAAVITIVQLLVIIPCASGFSQAEFTPR